MSKIGITLGATALALAANAGTADAFCGFYVEGSAPSSRPTHPGRADARRHADGAVDAERLQGPLATSRCDPVPVVLKEADVKTLSKDVLSRIESLGAPRLVEYWSRTRVQAGRCRRYDMWRRARWRPRRCGDGIGRLVRQTVKIEAKFTSPSTRSDPVGDRATGLERWLKANATDPEGAGPLLGRTSRRIEFFVAKVDPKKVTMVDGRAALSPIRFHYESEEFALPIRLGWRTRRQAGPDRQHHREHAVRVANYKNVVIPTNFD